MKTTDNPNPGGFVLTVQLPQVGRKRLTGTAALCSTATTLWIAAPAYLPFAVVSPMHVVEGIMIPLGVGLVALWLMEWQIDRELQPVERQLTPSEARR